MASTRLKRKALRNVSKAKKKVADIQRLNSKPVIKNVDIEEIKKQFSKGETGKSSSAEATGDTQKAEKKAEKAAAESSSAEATGGTRKAEKPTAEKTEKAAAESASAEATGGTRKTEKPAAEKAEKPAAEKAEAPKEDSVEETSGVDTESLLKSVGKADPSTKDDLKKITGIGPAFEKKLNEIGIFTFDQISKLKKNDIQNLGNLEGTSAEKIESDNWTGEAKNFMEAKKGE